jgi:hypothetical protein
MAVRAPEKGGYEWPNFPAIVIGVSVMLFVSRPADDPCSKLLI